MAAMAAHDGEQEGDPELFDQPAGLVVLPAGHVTDAHEQGQEGRQGQEHLVEPGEADRDLAPAHGLVDQRGQGAEQDQGGEGRQQQIVGQQEALPGQQVEAPARGDLRRPPGVEGQGPADDDAQEHQDEGAAGGSVAKAWTEVSTPERTRKGAQQAQGEGEQGQEHGPALEGRHVSRSPPGNGSGRCPPARA